MKKFLSIALVLALCLAGFATFAEAGKEVWISNDPNVLNVDAQGNYTAVGSGTAQVTTIINGQKVTILVTVEPYNCPWCETEVTTLEEMENHAAAPCGMEGHGICDGLDHESDLDPYCPDEPAHKACQAGATHVCSGEYGCGKTYACEDAGSHTRCAACGKPWCYKNAGSHATPACGNREHRACVNAGFDSDDHADCGVCGEPKCSGNHEHVVEVKCPGCQVVVQDIDEHKLDCGHYSCTADEEEYHGTCEACGDWYCVGEHGAGECVCGGCGSKDAFHDMAECGIHYSCQGDGHSLKCSDCKQYMCDASEHGKDVCVCGGCGSTELHEKAVCGMHYSCEDGAHGNCGVCGKPVCTGDHSTCIGPVVPPTTDEPTGAPSEAPTTGAPSEAPTTGAPSEAPTTGAPSEAPTTGTPSEAPTTGIPSEAPTTGAPSEAPTTGAPSEAPTTGAPSEAPTTGAPSEAPTTGAPSEAPTTGAPSEVPTTDDPNS